jgi:hypothetical protein
MPKSKEISVQVNATTVNKSDVEAKYQKPMTALVDKLISAALKKAKSKNIVLGSIGGGNRGYQISPTLQLLKNIGKDDDVKIRAEVVMAIVEVEGNKILGKVTKLTEGATLRPPSPLPKNLDGDYEAAVEAATEGAITKVIQTITK